MSRFHQSNGGSAKTRANPHGVAVGTSVGSGVGGISVAGGISVGGRWVGGQSMQGVGLSIGVIRLCNVALPWSKDCKPSCPAKSGIPVVANIVVKIAQIPQTLTKKITRMTIRTFVLVFISFPLSFWARTERSMILLQTEQIDRTKLESIRMLAE